MIKLGVHNAVVIIGLAVLGILVLRKLATTPLGTVPLLGAVLKLGAAA